MGFLLVLSLFISSVLCLCSLVPAQQLYAARATTKCSRTDNSVLGYSCNGLHKTCQAYLIFRSKPPYTTVGSISNLLGSDPSHLSAINSVSETAMFETNKMVIVPVNCSCSGIYYQVNASYVVEKGDTPFLIANNTYQGLSTCQAFQAQNGKRDIYPGETLTIPLRCACPTKNQSEHGGVKYLLSYIITWRDEVSSISARFHANTTGTLEANELNEDSIIYPFTTILVPLQKPPSSSQTLSPPHPPPSAPPLSPPSSPSSAKSSEKTWVHVIIGAIAGAALTLSIGIIIFLAFFHKIKKSSAPVFVSSEGFEPRENQADKKVEEESVELLESLSCITDPIKLYRFEELQAATDNFSANSLIQGSVHRGLINGDYAAIKKMNGDVSKEINLLNKINHSNIIRLWGVCFNDGLWYLVYQYAANGSLTDWLHCTSTNGEKVLTWKQRIQIALDIATGLNYLHSFTVPPHVHKDMKSSNVLLDSDFRAKIANLGLARSAGGQDGGFALTRHIVGTKGYMAPEYLENGLISTKVDVYSFGVVMLEIITGKEVAALYTEENMNLSDVLKNVLSEENGEEMIKELIDPSLRLQGDYPSTSGHAVHVVRVIDCCLRENPANRPAMHEIVQDLSRILTTSLEWDSSNNISVFHNF